MEGEAGPARAPRRPERRPPGGQRRRRPRAPERAPGSGRPLAEGGNESLEALEGAGGELLEDVDGELLEVALGGAGERPRRNDPSVP